MIEIHCFNFRNCCRLLSCRLFRCASVTLRWHSGLRRWFSHITLFWLLISLHDANHYTWIHKMQPQKIQREETWSNLIAIMRCENIFPLCAHPIKEIIWRQNEMATWNSGAQSTLIQHLQLSSEIRYFSNGWKWAKRDPFFLDSKYFCGVSLWSAWADFYPHLFFFLPHFTQ